mmetsp:Transcript_31575/g.87068  ORF Transcript_31575/g.87068 Transcript_31575/m.87068 type:complete len:463 (+) Transcript_31575:19-1407(+)
MQVLRLRRQCINPVRWGHSRRNLFVLAAASCSIVYLWDYRPASAFVSSGTWATLRTLSARCPTEPQRHPRYRGRSLASAKKETNAKPDKKSIFGRIFALLGFFVWWVSEPEAKAETYTSVVGDMERVVTMASSTCLTGSAATPIATGRSITLPAEAFALAGIGNVAKVSAERTAENEATEEATASKAELVEGLEAAMQPRAEENQQTAEAVDSEAELVADLDEARQPRVEESLQPAEAIESEDAVQPDAAQDAPLPAVPHVPGLSEATFIVSVTTDPKSAKAPVAGREGVDRLMATSHGTILGAMAQYEWEVRPLDIDKSLFEIKLPSVHYDLPVATVSIPAPLFHATVHDSFLRKSDTDYKERLIGNLVLQNGEDILTVELKFPFNRTFTISAAGWARARVGREGDCVRTLADVEIGLRLPKVPGLSSVMDFFVKSYGNQSTMDCAVALAKEVDKLFSEDS